MKVMKSFRCFIDGRRFACMALCLLICAAVMPACAGAYDDDGLLRLVNRDEMLPKSYKPSELVLPDVPTNKASQKESIYMRPEAAAALEALFAAAESEAGYHLLAVSGYRAYSTQYQLFKNKVASVGSRERAQKTVAPAGASEHQLGLAMDVVSDNFRYLNKGFLETDEGRWVNDNCWRFGFIIRYRAEWSDVTGCNAEPWHIRYLGPSNAEAVTRLGIPYETYAECARQLPDYILENADADLLAALVGDMLQGHYEMAEVAQNSSTATDKAGRALLAELTAYYAAFDAAGEE